MDTEKTAQMLENARELVRRLEQGELDSAQDLLFAMQNPQQEVLYGQVGQLTRKLHDSLKEVSFSHRLPELASHDIPDARFHLQHVINMTNQAANKTMDAIELVNPINDRLGNKADALDKQWKAVQARQMSFEQFKLLCAASSEFMHHTKADSLRMHGVLTDILMAQDYQDLTGQIISRVITLVTEVEERLIEILTQFGPNQVVAPKAEESAIKAEGPIINKEGRDDVVDGQADVDDLLASLGF